MAPKSSPSSHTSLVSIDSAIANHIFTNKSMVQSSHMRTESTPIRAPATSNLNFAKGHGRNNSAPLKHHKRSNSLRRAKNSTELLRQRSTKHERLGSSSGPIDSRRGRNFAVTNVGTGGLLYLRPSTYQRPMSPAISPPPLTPWTAPANTLVQPQESEDEVVVVTTEHKSIGKQPTTRTRSVSPKRLLGHLSKAKEVRTLPGRPAHMRSQSFSTIDESRKSVIDHPPKSLKIVINRPDQDRPRTTESGKPTLEIPIPSYKLGNPRFSTNGTPMLRSSGFTRASSTPSTRHNSTYRSEIPLSAPPPSSMRAFARLQTLDVGLGIAGDSENLMPPNPVPAPQDRASGMSSIGAAASIYDELSEVYNDPSVVRFAHNIKEVTAATPARIIAQISSESFMDYELVSDFFLTFRSYMSTIDVLDLLLARLKWAIGRMTDDGRIIRIRTFAALRHWILNYFMDDFVPNRYLRERFCDEVNDMYEDVLNQYVGVSSDLKILQDLKRCWNGRCSLYWDGEEFNMDGNPDDEIYPGGVLGSRNPDYINPAEVRHAPGQAVFHTAQSVSIQAAKLGSPTMVKTVHNRPKPSYASSGPAESVQSEQSFQPKSCSALLITNRNGSENQRSGKGPVPVSVLSRRQNAPAELTVTTNMSKHPNQHRRGASSIDSNRERTPAEIPKSAIVLPEPYEGSVIRGAVYGPVEPFVQLSPSLPMSPTGRYDIAVTSPMTAKLHHEQHLGQDGPAVKNIFGSIRRALSGKQGSSEIALITVSTQSSAQTLGPKKSPMPLNASRSQDDLRKAGAPALSKGNLRIDLLCAAAVESYRAARPTPQLFSIAEPKQEQADGDTLFPPPPTHRKLIDGDARLMRMASQDSAESGSILIMNDTDSELPIMSGAIQHPQEQHDLAMGTSQRTRSSADHYMPNDHTSFETQIAFQDDSHIEQAQEISTTNEINDSENFERRPSTPENERVLSSTASSTTMRHRHSLSSSVAQNRLLTSPGPTASVVTPPQDYHDENSVSSPKGPGQMLRRRPGGDLRKNQNVHEMEPAIHHDSVDSFANTLSMAANSILNKDSTTQLRQHPTQNGKKVSMIHTHSSQHLRPSFEAAVAGFSHIPDDDDGGLEATLLKLEGLYEKSPELGGQSPAPTDPDRYSRDSNSVQQYDLIPSSSPIPVDGRGYAPHVTPGSAFQSPTRLMYTSKPSSPRVQFSPKHPVFGIQNQSLARSEASTDSVPLLRRDVDGPQLAEAFGDPPKETLDRKLVSQHMKTDSREINALRGPSPGSYLTADNSNIYSEQSLIDDDDRSDLSSEISVDIINYSEAMGSLNSPMLVAPGTAISGLEIPSHPLAHSSFVNISLHPSLALDSKSAPMENPKTSEPILLKIGQKDSTFVRSNSPQNDRINIQRGAKISAGPAHMPFVLACDSQILAQQLTLVEQSALSEIEWSDLVEMKWNTSAAAVLDWAEYIANKDVKGVDLVITRFNLMVKWALSEIVLTQEAEERVRVITKLIHVAAHARRLHNYATMLQLTIALTSTDCTRMTKTWDMVPGPDKSLLKNMEALIQPVRNFHDLRLEMESADLSNGCVPFIGLYIHDLTYNAQKPAEIGIGRGLPPLVNFERFRTTAVIVKGLLRLIDASSKYSIEPIHGVIERCLWIAALPDERIRTLSRQLQQ